MEKERFIEMCKEQFISWENVEKNIEKLFRKKVIKLEKLSDDDYKEVYAVMDAVYRNECFGYTNGSIYKCVNRSQKRKSSKYLSYL